MPEAAQESGLPPDQLTRLLAGDKAALARAISILEAGGSRAEALARRLRPEAGQAAVIAFTGPPGAGKSTLVAAYISALRARGEPVAVLAVDPSSPISGGALLGDRTRMGQHSGDPGVFIRSLAARGHLGGLALSVPAILDALDAAGWPKVILETVGAGQSETEIAEVADVKVVLTAPGLGDDIQAIKAGILEIADVLVVNKCDLPDADRTARQLRIMLELRPSDRRDVQVVLTAATSGAGLSDLEDAIAARVEAVGSQDRQQRAVRRLRGLLRRHAEAAFHERLSGLPEGTLDRLCTALRSGEVSLEDAVSRLTRLAAGPLEPIEAPETTVDE